MTKWCTVGENYETKTVDVGEDVTLFCPRKTSDGTHLLWFRLVSGDLPEFLGGTHTFDYDDVNITSKTPCCTAKQEPGTFILILSKTQLSHTGLYFCVNQNQLKVTLLKGVFLRVKDPGPDITTVIQDISPDPARPWDSKTLQCSVFSNPDNKTCPGKRAFWFRAGSDESRPSIIYTHGKRSDGCEESSEAPSLQKCIYSFSKTFSSSDVGTYYCAVAACGEILFGNGTKLNTEGNNMLMTNTPLCLLSAALAICLIVIAFLVYTIKTKSSFNTAADLHRNAETASSGQQRQQRDESLLVYAAPPFSKKKKKKKKNSNGERRHVKRAEEETIYSGVRTVVTN
ncbi:uncharacterized protein LOC117817651 [Notolabrus celidotus]|uniref:uncharacterized protein LOC117817651 n=1 Tax=Notolabrus celidotus TaxID=1203425 RepID=UPI00148F67FA|nr:uncharacterized protein LOC117817651 [Notolabrus celidotus]